jgi:hypothetical protein
MNKVVCFFIIALCSLACGKNKLDLNDPANFTPQQFYKTQADMDVAVTGAYGRLRDVYNGFFYYWGVLLLLGRDPKR